MKYLLNSGGKTYNVIEDKWEDSQIMLGSLEESKTIPNLLIFKKRLQLLPLNF